MVLRAAIIAIVVLPLFGCGLGGMARSMQPVVEGFEEGERRSQEIRDEDGSNE